MKHTGKSLLSLLLVLAMAVGLLPGTALLATAAEEATAGTEMTAESLQALIDDNETRTITLSNDIMLSEALTIGSGSLGKSIYLDLNGHSLRNASGAVFSITGQNGSLTVFDNTGRGVISTSAAGANAINTSEGAGIVVNIYGGSVFGTRAGISLNNVNATANIYGGAVRGGNYGITTGGQDTVNVYGGEVAGETRYAIDTNQNSSTSVNIYSGTVDGALNVVTSSSSAFGGHFANDAKTSVELIINQNHDGYKLRTVDEGNGYFKVQAVATTVGGLRELADYAGDREILLDDAFAYNTEAASIVLQGSRDETSGLWLPQKITLDLRGRDLLANFTAGARGSLIVIDSKSASALDAGGIVGDLNTAEDGRIELRAGHYTMTTAEVTALVPSGFGVAASSKSYPGGGQYQCVVTPGGITVGDRVYDTFEQAVEAANLSAEDAVIRLNESVDVTSKITINGNTTLNLNGQEISFADTGKDPAIDVNGQNVKITGGGTITVTGKDAAAIHVQSGSTVELDGVTIKLNTDKSGNLTGTAIKVDNGGRMVIRKVNVIRINSDYTVIINDADNGSIDTSARKDAEGRFVAHAGEKVKLYPKPDTEFELDKIVVDDDNYYYNVLYKEEELPNRQTDSYYYFIMPANDVTVAPEFKAVTYEVQPGPDVYNIALLAGPNGSISGPARSTATQPITITVKPDPGFDLGQFKVNGVSEADMNVKPVWDEKVSAYTYSFMMPAGHVNIYASFVRNAPSTTYNITVRAAEHGTVTVSPNNNIAPGQTVTVEVKDKDSGYEFAGYAVIANGKAVDYSNNELSFSMPGDDVIVVPYFRAQLAPHEITINSTLYGKVVSSSTGAHAGDAVTLSAVPQKGCMLKSDSLKVNGGAVEVSPVGDGEQYIFIMPDEDVTVSAEFGPSASYVQTQYAINQQITGDGGLEITVAGAPATKAEQGQTVSVKICPIEGNEINGALTIAAGDGSPVELTKVDEESYTFEMPGTSVTLDAAFEPKNYGITVRTSDSNGVAIPTITGTYTDSLVQSDPVANNVQAINAAHVGDEITLYVVGNKDDAKTYAVDSVIAVTDTGVRIPLNTSFTQYQSSEYTVYTFTMPAAAVEIIPSFREKFGDYEIFTSIKGYGTIKVAESAEATTDVVVTVEPKDGYKLEGLRVYELDASFNYAYNGTEKKVTTPQQMYEMVNGKEEPVNKYQFTMPSANVEIEAKFETSKTGSFRIIGNDDLQFTTGGDIAPGMEVTTGVSVKKPNMKLIGLTLLKEGTEEVVPYVSDKEFKQFTFVMPESNVTVRYVLMPDIQDNSFFVSVDQNTGGTVIVTPEYAVIGDRVEFTVTPDEGYNVVNVAVNDETGDPVTNMDPEKRFKQLDDHTYQFYMPAFTNRITQETFGRNVVVNVTFAVKDVKPEHHPDLILPRAHTVTYTGGPHGTLSQATNGAMTGQLVTFTAVPDEGYGVAEISVTMPGPKGGSKVTLTEGENGEYSFIMPDADVKVRAIFAQMEDGITPIDVVDIDLGGNDAEVIFICLDIVQDGDEYFIYDENYRVKKITVPDGYQAVEENGTPKRLTIIPKGTYKVEVYVDGPGTAMPLIQKAAAGEEVKITLIPDDGRILNNLNITGVTDYNDEKQDDGTTIVTFVMPSSNVEVRAFFDSPQAVTYNVICKEPANGTLKASTAMAAPGQQIQVTAAANEGYRIKTVTYSYGANTETLTLDSEGKASFTMPDGDVTIEAVIEEIIYYTVTGQSENGTVSIHPERAEAGKTVTVTWNASDGAYKLAGMSAVDANGNEVAMTAGTNGNYTFTMPEANVTVTAITEAVKFTATVDNVQGGTIMIFDTENKAFTTVNEYVTGETVTVSVTAGADYELVTGSVAYVDKDGSKYPIFAENGGDYTFKMPSRDVKITAEFRAIPKVFAVSVKSGIVFGRVFASTDQAEKDTPVILSVESAVGFALKGITVSGGSEQINVRGEGGTYSFIMPGHDVEVDAEFTPLSYTINVAEGTENGKISVRNTKSVAGARVVVNAEPDEDCVLSALRYTDSNGNTTEVDFGEPPYRFWMPASDITVSGEFMKRIHDVKVEPAENGTVTANTDSATYGESITLSIVPDEGYELTTLTFTPAEGTAQPISVADHSATFSMPKDDVTVSAEFVKSTYKVNTASTANGEFTVDRETAQMGDTVNITVTADRGYALSGMSYTPAGGESISLAVENGKASFQMPASDVTLAATFEAGNYSVSVGSYTGGIVSSDKYIATINDVIHLNTVASTGYELGALRVRSDSGETVDVTMDGSSGSFNMPASNVAVIADFTKIEYTITINTNTNGTVTTESTKATMGDLVTLTPDAAEGYSVIGMSYTDANGETVQILPVEGEYSFEMPASDVTVTAEFAAASHKITIGATRNGTVRASATTAAAGAQITLTMTPSFLYGVKSITVADSQRYGVSLTRNRDGTYSFTMPNSDVTVGVNFSKSNFHTGKPPQINPDVKERGDEPFEPTNPGVTVKVETRTNADGSVTEIKTETETIEDDSGVITEKETITETTTDRNGNVTEEEVQQAETKTMPDGSTGKTVSDKDGNTLSADAKVTGESVKRAEESNKPVYIPLWLRILNAIVEDVSNVFSPPVTITLPETETEDEQYLVEVAIEDVNKTVVPVITNDEGEEEIISDSYIQDGSLIFPLEGGETEITFIENKIEFSDVPDNKWYAEAVDFNASRGIFNGTPNGFDPDGKMNRGMMAQILYNFDKGKPGRSYGFLDVRESDWYFDAVNWAGREGLMNGKGNNQFDPRGDITREEEVTMLFRYAQKRGYDTSVRGSLNSFSDRNQVHGWARDAMEWAVGCGLIQGTNNGIEPGGTATRAQTATMMERFIENQSRPVHIFR